MRASSTLRQGKKSAGFTLVELMVSMSVFSVIMLISTGVLLIMIDVNAKGQALYASYSNLAFALDSMTREIRTGRNYYCDESLGGDNFPTSGSIQDCADGVKIIFDRGWSEEQVGYRIRNQRIEQKITNSGQWFPITADEVLIRTLSLVVDGTAANNNEQPSVEVNIEGEIYNGLNTPTTFNISTRVVQRVLDR